MKSSFLSQHLEIKRTQSKDVLGIILFKPEWTQDEIGNFKEYCAKNGVNILEERNMVLSRNTIIALYKNMFSFSTDDLQFGIEWKAKTIEYLTSGTSVCLLVKGECVDKKLSKYKYALRNRHGKITHPKASLSVEDFKEKVIKNLVHVVDIDELQNALWLLFC